MGKKKSNSNKKFRVKLRKNLPGEELGLSPPKQNEAYSRYSDNSITRIAKTTSPRGKKGVTSFWQTIYRFFKKVATEIKMQIKVLKIFHKKISPKALKLPDSILFFASIFFSSFFIIAFETIQFHILLFTTNYLDATFIITIAMLGIAIGSILGFYLNRINPDVIIFAACVGLFFSIILSYYNIINIGFLKYPYFLILPFIFSSIIIAIIFARRNSNLVYFTNLLSSALGILFPIIMIPVFKSENCIFILMFIPVIIIILLSFKIIPMLFKLSSLIFCVIIFFWLYGFVSDNLKLPEIISASIFEEKILGEMPPGSKQNFKKNYTLDFFKSVYEKQKNDTYVFTSDDYDKKRADYFLRILGFKARFDFFPLLMGEKVTPINSMESIPSNIFEYELLPEIEKKYDMIFEKNYDRLFLEKVYEKDQENNVYRLKGTDYERKRAKYLLTALGHFETFDLNFDIKYHSSLRDLYKTFAFNHRILFSEDNMIGRLEYTGDDDYMFMSVDGVILDGLDRYNGAHFDPRVPRIPHQKSPKVFIVGLSADGIVKSCKRLSNAAVAGIEINPIVIRTMSEKGQFADFAHRPYDDVTVFEGEGRSYLENTDVRYDMIALMNIHMEHGPICTLSPEYFHTIEGTKLLLDRITESGYVVFEEIIITKRTHYFFLKFLNTIKQAMREMGISYPESHIHVFTWDFAEGGNAFRTLTIKRTPFSEQEVAEFSAYIESLKADGNYYNVGLLYSPYKKTNTELEEFIIGRDEYERVVLPTALGGDDFYNSILNKLNNRDDIRFLLSHYIHSSLNTFWISYNRLSEPEKYQLLKILDGVDYPYVLDLAPIRDDNPFPFNIYKNRGEVKEILNIVIMLSLILILPVVLLIFTKIKQYKVSLLAPNLFVAIIGFGYMLVEIVLMQKFQRFIGSPTYSLIVVLGGLLLFSGIGSFVSRYFSKKTVILLIAAIPVLLAIKLLFLDGIFSFLAPLSFTGKIVSSLFLIMPLTFLMGIPFPNALEIIRTKTSGEYASLLFGISGAFSTIGSTSSLLISVSYGFSLTFLIGAGCYSIGLLLFLLIFRKKG